MKSTRHEPLQAMPDAVLFDLDNTLYEYGPAHNAAMGAVQKKAVQTFSISADSFTNAFDQARQEVKTRLSSSASSHSRLLYFQRMLEIMGLGSQVLIALDFEQAYWRTFLGHAKIFENIYDFLDDLRLMGVPTAIVSNLTAQIQFRKIVYFGLDRYIDCVVTSEEIDLDKPSPIIFELAINKIRPSGDNIWMIGDDAEQDIRGARKAIGAITIQKIHAGVKKGEGDCAPDLCFGNYKELRTLINRINAQHSFVQKKFGAG